MRENELYDNLKGYLDNFVRTNVSLETLGIDVEDFKAEARDAILQRVNDMAAERLENPSEE